MICARSVPYVARARASRSRVVSVSAYARLPARAVLSGLAGAAVAVNLAMVSCAGSGLVMDGCRALMSRERDATELRSVEITMPGYGGGRHACTCRPHPGSAPHPGLSARLACSLGSCNALSSQPVCRDHAPDATGARHIRRAARRLCDPRPDPAGRGARGQALQAPLLGPRQPGSLGGERCCRADAEPRALCALRTCQAVGAAADGRGSCRRRALPAQAPVRVETTYDADRKPMGGARREADKPAPVPAAAAVEEPKIDIRAAALVRRGVWGGVGHGWGPGPLGAASVASRPSGRSVQAVAPAAGELSGHCSVWPCRQVTGLHCAHVAAR